MNTLLEQQLEKIPQAHKITLYHLTPNQVYRKFGSTGRDEDWMLGLPTKADCQGYTKLLWYCVITPVNICIHCNAETENRWYRGHGETCDEAIQEALSQMQG
jgi:hypothetical protein